MEPKDYYQPPSASAAVPEAFADAPIFALHGRLGRVRYLGYGILGGFLVFLPPMMLAGALGAAGSESASMAAIGIGYVAALAFSIVLSIRRCHDFNSSGWLSLISLVPLLNLALYLIPGTEGPNRFGARPRPNSTAVIVLALILPLVFVGGIMAAVALPAYNEYIDNANIAKMNSHYEEGARYVTNEMRKHRAETMLGKAVTLPDTSEGWITLINPTGALAPNGSPAYQAGADVPPDSGVVGVEVSGTATDGSLVVRLHRGSYQELPADRVDVIYAEL